jgi:hypothetical protein
MAVEDLYGWFPRNQPLPGGDRWMTIPGGGQGPLAGAQASQLAQQAQGGPLSQYAYELANQPRMKPGAGSMMSGSSDMYGSGATYGESYGGGGGAIPGQEKLSGAASGALTGAQAAGPWGAVIGGVAGYALNGGADDLNPLEASGFTGVTMEDAFNDGNYARIFSNPGGAAAYKAIGYDSALSPTSWGLGINPNSFAGKVLDPVHALDPVSIFESGNNPEEKTRDQYYGELTAGNLFTDPKLFTEGVTGEFRASRSTYPPRASGQYGPKDDDKFQADLATKINSAYSSGAIGAGDDAWSIYDKVVNPWFESMGGMKQSKAPEQHTQMTIDMINRYIAGSPITWQEARGGTPDYAVPKYLGLGG